VSSRGANKPSPFLKVDRARFRAKREFETSNYARLTAGRHSRIDAFATRGETTVGGPARAAHIAAQRLHIDLSLAHDVE